MIATLSALMMMGNMNVIIFAIYRLLPSNVMCYSGGTATSTFCCNGQCSSAAIQRGFSLVNSGFT